MHGIWKNLDLIFPLSHKSCAPLRLTAHRSTHRPHVTLLFFGTIHRQLHPRPDIAILLAFAILLNIIIFTIPLSVFVCRLVRIFSKTLSIRFRWPKLYLSLENTQSKPGGQPIG